MQPSNGSNKPWISGRGPLQRRDYRMDNHARERGSLDLLCNQRNNDLHRHSSKGTTDNDAHITDPTRHRNSRCTGSLLNGIRTRLHPAPRRQLPNPSSSTDPLEKRAGDGSPSKKPLFSGFSSYIDTASGEGPFMPRQGSRQSSEQRDSYKVIKLLSYIGSRKHSAKRTPPSCWDASCVCTSLAPRNSANRCIVCPIFDEISLPLGAPRSACIELIKSFSFFLSVCMSALPMSLSPYRMG